MSISQEAVPESVEEVLREFLNRRFLDIGQALDVPAGWRVLKEPPYKPPVGSVYYFGDPLIHNYDPAITEEGWWGVKSTGWVQLG